MGGRLVLQSHFLDRWTENKVHKLVVSKLVVSKLVVTANVSAKISWFLFTISHLIQMLFSVISAFWRRVYGRHLISDEPGAVV